MTIVTHVLGTALGVQVLGLRGRDAYLAYAFGVAVDLDHVVKVPRYLKAVGWANRRGYYWRSSLQEPVALLWIVPLSFLLGTAVPTVFFLLHLAMDYLVSYEKMPWYPYSLRVTRGCLVALPDWVKEGILLAVFACSNLFLLWNRP